MAHTTEIAIGGVGVKSVYLEISCWQGISLGAEHYYGSLTQTRPDYKQVKLTKVMTQAEANASNDKDSCEFCQYEAGEETERFDSESEVKSAALTKWKEIFPDAEILFCGNSCHADPTEILVAPEPILTKGNELYKRARQVGFWDFSPEKMQKIANEWDALFKGMLI